MLTTYQKELVQTSFAKVLNRGDHAATLFYKRLLELDPTFQTVLSGNMRDHSRKLIGMGTIAVGLLDHLDDLIPAVKRLEERHVSIRLCPEHYAIIGAALLCTLERTLGVDFTAEIRDAWMAIYSMITETATEHIFALM
jgi:hemoglobin-like flavoprotein